MVPVGLLILALLSLPGAMLTNHLLRDRLDVSRLAIAVMAGAAASVAVCAVAFVALEGTGGEFGDIARLALARDGWVYGAIITFAGPLATAAAVWKWRPRTRLAGDLRP